MAQVEAGETGERHPPHSPPGRSVVLARPGFFAGAGALFSGVGFVARHPSVWPLALVPVTLAVALTATLTLGGMRLIAPRLGPLSSGHHGFFATILEIALGLVVLATAAFVALAFTQPLSGASLHRIVARAEGDLGAPPRRQAGALTDTARALLSVALAYGIGIPLLALLWIVTLVAPPLEVVTFPLKLAVLALMGAWDLCDYPLSRRDLPIRERVAIMRRNLGAMLGFGLGVALFSSVPLAILVLLPVGVAGAARLLYRIEQFEGARGEGPHPRG